MAGDPVLITRLKLENWRNFLSVDVPLRRRVFLVGPNASGKSNLLDALRFLRDIADPEGGLQRAVLTKRNSVSQIRSLHARRYPHIAVEVEVDLGDAKPWRYRLAFSQDNQRRPIVQQERVWRGTELLLDRPDAPDRGDESRLTQTYLEQVSANKAFRPLQGFFAKIRYMHIVPLLVRDPDRSVGIHQDPFGGDFLEQIAKTPHRVADARLKKIVQALKVAVPQLEEVELHRDQKGVPHLRGLYKHWRPKAGWQTEDQFSDGTLRLLGLLWALLDGGAPLLLEEPELSLHPEVVRQIPLMIARLGRRLDRQILVSTHSADLLSDRGIDPEEVLILEPSQEDTRVSQAASHQEILALLRGGVSMAEAVLPRTAPQNAQRLALW